MTRNYCFLLLFGKKGCVIYCANIALEWFLSTMAESKAHQRNHSKTKLGHKIKRESTQSDYLLCLPAL